MRTTLLSQDFLAKYPDFPLEMNGLGKFVYYRTYSRWLPEKKRRETWKETCARAVTYNMSLSNGNLKALASEAEEYFDNMFHLREFLSGRTLWVGGTPVAEKYPMSNFNCAFTVIEQWSDFRDLFYLLMVGTGVGFRILRRDIAKLKPVRQGVELFNHPYRPIKGQKNRNESTEVDATTNPKETGSNVAVITIGDSKEGWVEALYRYFELLTEPDYAHVTSIHVIYDHIRPKGARLKTFGGTASGGESMVAMFEKIHNVLMSDRYAPKPVNGVLRPIHALDIANIIGQNVVVGGVRRTSEIALLDPKDKETLEAKRTITVDTDHRRMSNNSVFYEEKPTRGGLHDHFEIMRRNGEPAFINALAAKVRKAAFEGVNPCGEVLLRSKQLCNLVTTNVMAFVRDGILDIIALTKAHRLNARAALRMTLVDLELPEWDKVHKADRIVGVAMMGWYDMLDNIDQPAGGWYEETLQMHLKEAIKDELETYCKELGIDVPELATTMKPDGTISKVAGGRSPGAHRSRAPHYIRRIRVNAHDPILRTAEALGWSVHNEVGQGVTDSEGTYIPVTTKVVEFPVKSGAKITTLDVTALDQLDTYYRFQKHYTEHNTSITIDVYPDEWEDVEQNIWDNWDNFVGVSFLERFTDFYPLLPEETCSEETYLKLAANMSELDIDMLNKFELELENAGEDFELAIDDACASGACPMR